MRVHLVIGFMPSGFVFVSVYIITPADVVEMIANLTINSVTDEQVGS